MSNIIQFLEKMATEFDLTNDVVLKQELAKTNLDPELKKAIENKDQGTISKVVYFFMKKTTIF